jgi:hypothetical protein
VPTTQQNNLFDHYYFFEVSTSSNVYLSFFPKQTMTTTNIRIVFIVSIFALLTCFEIPLGSVAFVPLRKQLLPISVEYDHKIIAKMIQRRRSLSVMDG